MIDLNSPNTKLVVVGGGTAGWLTALLTKKRNPNTNVSIIESSEIGILGAGEGTTPHFIDCLNELEIPIGEIIKYAGGTIKNGIKFTNWNGDNKFYYHGFTNYSQFSFQNVFRAKNSTISTLVHDKIFKQEPLNDYYIDYYCGENNLVKFFINPELENTTLDPVTHFKQIGYYSLHFNARLLANYLKFVGVSRNIKCIDAQVNSINTDEKGYIKSLNLSNNDTLPTDFVYDCTGFKRLIIGNFYKAEWESYKKIIPANRAVPFFIDIPAGTLLPPYTEAIAMKYGWSWKIPIQDRFGCGYVFNKNDISDEEVTKELKQTFGETIQINNSFNFEAGAFKTPWIKNCVAVGLAAGFIEPLEATSIWATVIRANDFLREFAPGMTVRDETCIKLYNALMHKTNKDILNFIYFHYITKRTDTNFWKKFTEHNKMPEKIKEFYNYNCSILCVPEILKTSHAFSIESWISVGTGLNFYNKDLSEIYLGTSASIQNWESLASVYKKNIKFVTSSLLNHNEFINYILQNS